MIARSACVLDLCCGTGLSMANAVSHFAVRDVVGVDICKPYLDFARRAHFGKPARLALIEGDAVTVDLPDLRWDMVILSSAYHHIEDERKLTFLRRVRGLLSGDKARALIAENLLPEYAASNKSDYARAVREFYSAVLSTAKSANPHLDPHVQGLIERVAQYGCDGDYEYKSSWSIFLRDLHSAGLGIIQSRRVWPDERDLLGGTGGNYVIEVKPL